MSKTEVGGNDDGEDFRPFSDGLADVTYHTPAWHKARIESLMVGCAIF